MRIVCHLPACCLLLCCALTAAAQTAGAQRPPETSGTAFIEREVKDWFESYAEDLRAARREAMLDTGILPRLRGTLVRDGYLSYTRFEQCRNALCNAHLLRELVFIEEMDPAQAAWTKPLAALLIEIKEAAAWARARGDVQLGKEAQGAFVRRYDRLVKNADKLNPQPRGGGEGDSPKRKRPPLTPQRRLVNRLVRRRDEVLRLMSDLAVPLTNNGAERDLRMVKVQQKVGGCFRTEHGARDFCRVRSYLSTAHKQGHPLLHALERVLNGKPLPLEASPA